MARYLVNVQNTEYDIELEYSSEKYIATVNGRRIEIINHDLNENRSLLLFDGDSYEVDVRSDGHNGQRIIFMTGVEIQTEVEDYHLAQLRKTAGMSSGGSVAKVVKATMPGLIVGIKVKPGQKVTKGDALMVIEAMKMENVIKAGDDAVVKAIKVESGQAVDKGTLLLEFE